MVSGSGVTLVREKVKSSAQAVAARPAAVSSVAATVRRSRSSSVPAATQRSSSTRPSGSRSWKAMCRWAPWLSSSVGPLVADVGAPAPEVVPLDVGNGDTDAEVMEVVGRG